LVKPSAGPSRLSGKWDTRSNFNLDAINEKDDSDKKSEGLSSVGLNFVNGDALSLLLEKKLKELTSKIEPSINFTRGDTFVPTNFSLEEPVVSSSSNWDMESGVFDCSPSEGKPSQYVDYCQSAQSSTKGQIFRGSKLQVNNSTEPHTTPVRTKVYFHAGRNNHFFSLYSSFIFDKTFFEELPLYVKIENLVSISITYLNSIFRA
jgi:hypothetical protein